MNDFKTTINVSNWNCNSDFEKQLKSLLEKLSDRPIYDFQHRRQKLIYNINRMFDINKKVFRNIIDLAAEKKVIFNFHEKEIISKCLDELNYEGFVALLMNEGIESSFIDLFKKEFVPVIEEETLMLLQREMEDAKRQDQILHALLGSYIYNSFEEKILHQLFSNSPQNPIYEEGYYSFLKGMYPDVFNRDCSLIYVGIDEKLRGQYGSSESFNDSIFTFISEAFERLNNHCYLAVLIKPICENGKNIQWDLYSNLILFAERFKEIKLEKAYFKPSLIETETKSCIKELKSEQSKFEISNEGFNFKDCFILTENLENIHLNYDLLILLEKNERDERPIPCPACRSINVQGNSYPVINVKSWECNNPFCHERSKTNRGKRYSLASLIKQKAINEDENLIPIESLRKWRLDVVNIETQEEILEMLVRHYTLFNDIITLVNLGNLKDENLGNEFLGRHIKFENYPLSALEEGLTEKFFKLPFFKRFLYEKKETGDKVELNNLSHIEDAQVFNGDAYKVLQQFESNFIDGAVTSPPYYNAKDYANWKNIYCYLYDMYNIIKECYRVLKPGAAFLFNIFDYFDNENITVFSDMGKKRIILGAYTIYLFKQAGFEVNDNIIWYKGEINGKRNFNQGNNSPYYQAPFNCWEHILVFSKGKLDAKFKYPKILRAHPVVKMIKGKNTLGHDAPFPKDIPNLLLNNLEKKSIVLEPFSGTMTTGRAAFEAGIKSINIDYMYEYCIRGLELLEDKSNQIK